MPCSGCLGKEEWGPQDRPSKLRPPVEIVEGWYWHRIEPAIEKRIDHVVNRWIGTRYAEGQRVRGGSVDCLNLAVAIADELYRKPKLTAVPKVTATHAANDGSVGAGVSAILRDAYPDVAAHPDRIEPGDFVIVTAERQGRGQSRRSAHILIATGTPFSFVHAVRGSGVVRTSLAGMKPIAVYGSENKDQWI